MPSGWLLLVCLFLPSLKFCDRGEPLPMALFPFLWPPYLVGAVIAIAAAQRPENIRSGGFTLFMLIRMSAVGLGGSMLVDMIEGAFEPGALIVIAACIFAFAATWRPPTERAVAANSAMAATGSFAFTLAIALDRHAVWGAYVGAITAGVLLAGTLGWCLEVLVARSAQRRCTSWR